MVEDVVGSTLASIASMFMGNNMFDSKARASMVDAPVLLMHGEKDNVAAMNHCFNMLGNVIAY